MSRKTSGRGSRRNAVQKPPRKSRPERVQSSRSRPEPSHNPNSHGNPHAKMRVLKGRIDKNQKGFAFLIFEDRKIADVFIPPREASTLFHGDRVEVRLGGRGDLLGMKVIEHRFRELVGRYEPHPQGKGAWVIYERKKTREEVFTPKSAPGVRPGDWVRAKIEFHETGPHRVTATLLEVYGPELPPSADVDRVSAEYGLVEAHAQDAVAEALRLGKEVAPEDLREAGRVDLRKVPFITIDGETARDFDDAVFVERVGGEFVLWVAIADVSHYVRETTGLDREAYSRGTSVYFPERAFHMLPGALSENLCSLRPKEIRLAMAAKMRFDLNGKRLSTEVMNAVIESRRRATYTEIQAEWETNKNNSKWEYAPHFFLYQILRKKRSERGSIDFDLPEPELIVKPNGEVVSIKNRPRVDAHRLIEEFMIAANESVTEWIGRRKWPFVFRLHEEPSEEALEKFKALAATVGIVLPARKGPATPKALSEIVKKVQGHPAEGLLNFALLRSMKQAVYSAVPGGHYGLASPGYTHFTSPIRRYPDLVVHRLLKQVLKKEQGLKRGSHGATLNGDERKGLERELEKICEHCSYRERLATDAEREAIKLKQVRAIAGRLGDEFDAQIVGMAESGVFVRLEDPFVEGLLPKESIDAANGDFFSYNEDRMVYFGRRKKVTLKIGQVLRVQAARADLDRLQIEFAWAKNR